MDFVRDKKAQGKDKLKKKDEGDTTFLIIDPKEAFIESDAHAYHTLKLSGKSVYMLGGKSGTLTPSTSALVKEAFFPFGEGNRPVPVDTKVLTPADFKQFLAGLSLKDGGQIVLHFTGHGSAPPSLKDNKIQIFRKLGAAKVKLGEVDMSWNQLRQFIQEYPRVNFKVISETCYGGGVHILAHTLENVCTAATAPFFKKSCSIAGRMSHFTEGLYNHLRHHPRSSFARAALAGFANDSINKNQGSLSSFDYVDGVLGKGVYAKDYSSHYDYSDKGDDSEVRIADNLLPEDFSSVIPDISDWAATERLTQEQMISLLDQIGRGPSYVEEQSNCPTIQSQTPSPTSLPALERMRSILQALSRDLPLDAQYNSIFHQALDSMEKNYKEYGVVLQKYQTDYDDFLAEVREYEQGRKMLDDHSGAGLSISGLLHGLPSSIARSHDSPLSPPMEEHKKEELRKKVEKFEMKLQNWWFTQNFLLKVPGLGLGMGMGIGRGLGIPATYPVKKFKMDEMIQAKKNFLKRQALRDPLLKEFVLHYNVLQGLERLEEFSRRATNAQKRKFFQLMKCEWEEL